MVKKLFALASVTALTGLMGTVAVAGCSSTTVQAADGDAATGPVGDAKPPSTPVQAAAGDAATGPGGDARPPVTKKDGSATDDDRGEPATGTCPTLDPIDATALPWKSPAKLAGACTEKELTGLITYVDANS